jgi:hypothetical protein
VAFLLHENRAVARLEDVAAAIVPFVEALGIDPVELSHAGRQIRLRRLHDEVVVVVHQAVGVAKPAESLDDAAKRRQEAWSVVVVEVDPFARVAA